MPGLDVARGVTLLEDGSGYVVDAFGGIHRFASGPTLPRRTRLGPTFPGPLAHGIAALRDTVAGTGGYVVDVYGGLHGFDIGTNGGVAVP